MDEFILPEDLTTLSQEDLDNLRTQAIEAFDEIRTSAADDLTDTDVSTLAQLADAVDAIVTEGGRRDAARAEAAEAVSALVGRVHPDGDAAGDAPTAEGGDAPEAPADPPADPEAPADPPAEGADAPEGIVVDDPELVTASGGPTKITFPRARKLNIPLAEARRRQAGKGVPEAPAPKVPAGVVMTAAADLADYGAGVRFPDTTAVALAMHDRAGALNLGGKSKVARIDLPAPVDGTAATDAETFAELVKENFTLDSMVAAGGWCAPSETSYDFFQIEGAGGLLDLPSMTVSRGGIEFPVSPSMAAVSSVPWVWTEADDIEALDNPHEDPEDDVVKPCFRIPCPTFDAERLAMYGICVTHGNLSDMAYPELTTRYVNLVMAMHLHDISRRHLLDIVAGSTSVTIPQTGPNLEGAAAPILFAVELAAIDYRAKYYMNADAVLEGMFPSWQFGAIRADLALRTGMAEMAVTDAQILEWFDIRGIRAQFPVDWQNRAAGYPGVLNTPAVAYPDLSRFIIQAPGTWVEGRGPGLSLGVSRDKAQNDQNDFTAAWTEESRLLARIGHESRVYTVPQCVNGATKLAVNFPCVVADTTP